MAAHSMPLLLCIHASSFTQHCDVTLNNKEGKFLHSYLHRETGGVAISVVSPENTEKLGLLKQANISMLCGSQDLCFYFKL